MNQGYSAMTKSNTAKLSIFFLFFGFLVLRFAFHNINLINAGEKASSVAVFFWIGALGGMISILGGIVGFFLEFFCPYIWIDEKSITFGRRFLNTPLSPQTKIFWDNIISINTPEKRKGKFLIIKTIIEYKSIKGNKTLRKTKVFSPTMGMKEYLEVFKEVIQNAPQAKIDDFSKSLMSAPPYPT